MSQDLSANSVTELQLYVSKNISLIIKNLPVSMAARCEAVEHWDWGFKSRSRYGYISAFFCVVLSCVGTDLAMGQPPFKQPYPVLPLSTTSWKRIGEWRYRSTYSLTSALDGGEWLASHPGRFTPRERVPGTQWIGGWVGPRAGLDAVVKRKIPNPRLPAWLRRIIV
jgi:hypothetical protein